MSNDLNTLIDERIKHINNLIKEGKPEFAQFESAKLVAQYPRNIMALCQMTYVFYIVNDPKNSTRYARLAYAQASSDSSWREIVSASNALLMVGEIEEANAVMHHLDLAKVDDAQELSYIARHYGSLDQVEMAAKIFDRISASTLDFHSRQMYGVSLLYLGKFAEARAEFEKAIGLNPMDGVSYNQLSVLKVTEKRDERIAAMLKVVDSPKLDAVNKSYMHFSLFNEYDAMNNPEAAWEHLQKANQVRRSTVHHDASYDSEACQNIIDTYRQLPTPSGALDGGTVPIFIVGLPRTGTTLLEKILSSFGEVQPCGELRAFRRELEIASNANFIDPFGLGFQKNIAQFDYDHIGLEYLRKNAWRHEGKKYFTDKEPSNYVYAGLIARAIPNAKIIHITRNPMDACFSNYKQFFGPASFTYSYDLADIADHYRLYAKIMQFWKQLAPDSILDVKYESLVDDPEGQAERIRQFCGLKRKEGGETESPAYITSTLSAAQVRAPIHKGNVNSWERYRVQMEQLYIELREYVDAYERELRVE